MSNTIAGYGNWRKPRSIGVGGFSMGATIGFIALIVVAALTMACGHAILGFGVGAGGLILLGLFSIKNTLDRNAWMFLEDHVSWLIKRLKAQNTYISGVLDIQGLGRNLLPGILSKTRLHEASDAYGRRFVLVEHESTGLYTIVLQAQPDGMSLVDPEVIDTWVANWAAFLTELGHQTGLDQASVTIETAPDTGFALRQEVEINTHPTAHPLAKQMLTDVVNNYPSGSANLRAFIALTFNAKPKGQRKIPKEQMIHELAAKLPQLTSMLSAAGAGAAAPLNAKTLTQTVRIAYDPDAQDLFARAHYENVDPGITWEDAGPGATRCYWDKYVHEGATSITWEMAQAPKGIVRSDVLGRLLAPNEDIARKRVTLLYKPIPAGRTASVVDEDLRQASVRAESATRGTSRWNLEAASARKTASEEAAGAGIGEFGLLVTATIPYGEDTSNMATIISNLASQARIRLRTCYGRQDSAFAIALPLGIIPSRYSLLPAQLGG